MSKLPDKFNNPVDIGFSKIYIPWMPFLKTAGITPNMLTTASMVCGLYSAKLITDKKPKLAALFFILNYFFDCMDGYMARRYKMETKFGDWYDHLTDWVTMALVSYALIRSNKYSSPMLCVIIILMLALTFNTLRWFGCQEKKYNGNIGESISVFKKFCNDPDIQLIETKNFGNGTLALFVCLVIYFSQHK